MQADKKGLILSWVVIIVFVSALLLVNFYLPVIRPQILRFVRPSSSPSPDLVATSSPTLSPTVLPAPLASDSAVVKRVIDGDTIELETGQTLRYIGMDTPETKHPTKGQECFGREASERNRELVEGQTVRLEKDVSEVDRYGRLLRYVWIDESLINRQLVAEGYALARSFPPDIARQAELFQAEQTARVENRGLWAACQPEL